jgi:hypothetical protein
MYHVHHHLKIHPMKKLTDPQRPDLPLTAYSTMLSAYMQVVGVENEAGKHIAKQLHCTTSIANAQNNAIHRILFSQHMTLNWLNHLASK